MSDELLLRADWWIGESTAGDELHTADIELVRLLAARVREIEHDLDVAQSKRALEIVTSDLLTEAKIRLERAEAERDALRAENEQLRADAERYRWLRGAVPEHSVRWSRWRIEHWASPGPTWTDITGVDLDAAIDAALALGEKP